MNSPEARRQQFYELLDKGYSPIPIRSGPVRKPHIKDYQDFINRQPTGDEVEKWLQMFPDCNIGLPLGRLHGVDIDDEVVLPALAKTLPPCLLGKTCNKGLTAFYLAPGLASRTMGRTLVSREGVETKIPSVEFMGEGRTTTVWGRHPVTGKFYQWMGEIVRIDELGPLTEADQAQCEPIIIGQYGPLAYGVNRTNGHDKTTQTGGYIHIDARTEAWARAALDGEANKLAATMQGGRANQLFSASCALGKYALHNVLPEGEIVARLLDACKTNGLLDEEGDASVFAQWRSGLSKAVGDSLPVIAEAPIAPAFGYQISFTPAPAPALPPTIRIFTLADMPSRPAPGLIHDVYPLSSPGDFSYLFGGYGSAKTHYELRKLFNIATGTDFFGNKTIKGLCVFYAAENPESVRRRFYCLIRHFKIKNPEEIPLLIIPGFGDLKLPENIKLLKSAIAPYQNKYGPVRLMSMDTVATTFRIAEENSPREWIEIEDICRNLGNDMGGCVNLLHHLGKDPSRGGRGSSAIGGSHDFSVTAEKQADGTFKVGPGPGDKTRDQAAGSIRSICFRLERYVLDAARDLHGDPWESAYAVECREVPKVQDNRKGLVFWNQAFFRVSVGGRASEPEMRRVFLEIYPSETQKGKETAWQREKAQHTISMDGDLRFYADESPEGMFGPPLNP